MSILTGFKKQKEYSTDHDGNHKLVSTWTHADTVDVGNDAVLSDVFTYDPHNQEVNMQTEGYDTIDGGSMIRLMPGLLNSTYSKRDSNNNVSASGTVLLSPNFFTNAVLALETNHTGSDAYGIRVRPEDIDLSGTYNNEPNTWDGTNTSLKDTIASTKELAESFHVIHNYTANITGSIFIVLTLQTLAPAFPVPYLNLNNYYISSFWLEKSNERIFYDGDTNSSERIISIKQSGTGLGVGLTIQMATVAEAEYSIHLIFKPVTTGIVV